VGGLPPSEIPETVPLALATLPRAGPTTPKGLATTPRHPLPAVRSERYQRPPTGRGASLILVQRGLLPNGACRSPPEEFLCAPRTGIPSGPADGYTDPTVRATARPSGNSWWPGEDQPLLQPKHVETGIFTTPVLPFGHQGNIGLWAHSDEPSGRWSVPVSVLLSCKRRKLTPLPSNA